MSSHYKIVSNGTTYEFGATTNDYDRDPFPTTWDEELLGYYGDGAPRYAAATVKWTWKEADQGTLNKLMLAWENAPRGAVTITTLVHYHAGDNLAYEFKACSAIMTRPVASQGPSGRTWAIEVTFNNVEES